MDDIYRKAVDELHDVLVAVDKAEVAAALDVLAGARRIALYGVGREGLQMKGFAMRLFHLGLDAHVVGDMTTPHLGDGDLLIVSAGPGDFSTVSALIGVARSAGAKSLCVTAEPDGAAPRAADVKLVVPAQTMARDTTAPSSVLPMGSLYEGALYVLFEILILQLRERLAVDAAEMRSRHTNLE
ncbi:SIS domain-containing protein [Pseudaminobacter sp. 19-2017]|uniref:SIS domain-containing protein n=1 Tax=Pseudaminobacter soli (ex Zhang et al. 2022) TaxID=2831468 RepID=A0A942I368_9HYPH|nr:SIS domain-containing protein [Pseudaminobacter soli]MBS3649474.1 SIS domain-containing protein [Pseudaminobacter soli]